MRVEGRVWVQGRGKVRIGPGVRLAARVVPIELNAGPGAEIVIGERAIVEGGCSIEALASVRIGSGARLGAFSKIVDNHFHRTVGPRSEHAPSVPVEVGEGAILGARAVLLPGARIGARSHVAAATVVSKAVPDATHIFGMPPRMRSLT